MCSWSRGALTASRGVFHMADLNSALQVMLAYKARGAEPVDRYCHGVSAVGAARRSDLLLLGLPYHFVAGFAEKLHVKLADKKWIKPVTFHRGVRSVFYVIFALLAVVTGYTVFETISPTGILAARFDLWTGPGTGLGRCPAAVRDLRLEARMVSLCLPDRPDLRAGQHLAGTGQIQRGQLPPEGRLPEGVRGAARVLDTRDHMRA